MQLTRSARRLLPAVSLMVLACSAGAAAIVMTAEPPAEAASRPQNLLEPLKALAGEWEMQDESGKTVVGAVFRVTSAGSAVQETMFPGSPHEMVNLYHLDGPGTLVVTHYCAVGNQPRMTGGAPKTPGVYEFTIKDPMKDVSNLKSPEAMYMGQYTLTIKDADTLIEDWVHTDKGKPGGKTSFELKRRKPSAP